MFGKFVHQQHRIEKNPRWVGLTRARIKLFTIKLIRDLILTTMVICFFTGIEGDIYYIRDGQIKLNAVNLNMTVPYRVNCLRFIWFSKPVVSIFNMEKPMLCFWIQLQALLKRQSYVVVPTGLPMLQSPASWSCTLWKCHDWAWSNLLPI